MKGDVCHFDVSSLDLAPIQFVMTLVRVGLRILLGRKLICYSLGTLFNCYTLIVVILSIVCSQTSCAVLSHCFTDRTCARESTFFV